MGADFVARKPMGRKSQIFEQIYTGQMTVRDSRKFVQKFVRQKIAKFGKFARRICSEQIFEQKKIIWAIFRQAIEGSKFDEKIVKFPQAYAIRRETNPNARD